LTVGVRETVAFNVVLSVSEGLTVCVGEITSDREVFIPSFKLKLAVNPNDEDKVVETLS